MLIRPSTEVQTLRFGGRTSKFRFPLIYSQNKEYRDSDGLILYYFHWMEEDNLQTAFKDLTQRDMLAAHKSTDHRPKGS
jgi:hypothetical protein